MAKGNGYGLGLSRLAAEATRLGVDRIAVGSVFEVAAVAQAFPGDILVLTPWDPRDTVAAQHWLSLDPAYSGRIIRTVSDAQTVRELPAGSRIVI